MVQKHMIPVFALLVESGGWEITRVPKHYQIPVTEYLAAEVEKENKEK